MTILKKFPVLYKKSKSNKFNVWNINVIKDEDDDKIYLETTRGTEGGKMVITQKEIKKGKGKKTKTEQAISDATSKMNAKIKKNGYLQDKNAAKISIILRPMLASKFDIKDLDKKSRSVKIKLPCYVQPKLDGLRCISYLKNGEVVLQSRQMVEYNNLNKIRSNLKPILEKLPKNFYFDGELYTDAIPFELIAGICRLKTNLDNTEKKKMDLINYHIYDCFQINMKMPYDERLKLINENVKGDNLKTVETILISQKDEIKKQHDIFVKKNYEGLMLRNIKSYYELDKRSKNLQKFKEFLDEEFFICGYFEGTGSMKQTPIWECETNGKDKKKFRATPKGSLEYRRELFKNASESIGKKVTVRFQELTKAGIPRFPIAIAIRQDY